MCVCACAYCVCQEINYYKTALATLVGEKHPTTIENAMKTNNGNNIVLISQ